MPTSASSPSPAVLPWTALAALEWTDTPMWVFDLTGKQMRWSNQAGLEFWNASSLEDFLARDFSDLSPSTIIRNQAHMDEHIVGRCGHEQWTLYPKGQPTTVDIHSVGITLPEGHRAILYEVLHIMKSPDPFIPRGVEAMQQTPLVIALFRIADGSVVMRNPAGVQHFGSVNAFERQDDFSAMFVDSAQAEIAWKQIFLQRKYQAEVELHTLQGDHWYDLDVRPMLDPVTGETVLQINAQDISQRKQAEADLQDSETLFRAFFNNNLDAALLTTMSGEILTVNPEAQRMLGYSAAEFRRIRVENIVDTVDQRLALAQMQCSQMGWFRGELTFIDKEGRRFPCEVSSSVFNGKGESTMRSMLVRDITERQEVEQQLRIAATAFESQEGMVVTDAQKMILRVNQSFTRITGYTAEEAIGRNIRLLQSGQHEADFYVMMWQKLYENGSWQGEVWNRRKNGETYPQWLTITAVKNTAGEVTQYVASLIDITLRKAAEDEVKQLAFYDPLTLLPNRRLLLNRLEQSLVVSWRTHRLGALLFIDLDNFKMLNDTLGHDKGDCLLKEVAHRLSSCVRESDTVARLGGDEFVILLEDLSKTVHEAVAQADAIGRKILLSLNQPYALGEQQPYHSTASIGITLLGEQQDSVDDLMKRADLAMYESKAAGRNTLCFFDPQMQANIKARATLEADLRRGLPEREFCLYFQPQVDSKGHITSAEVLVRWNHPEHGLLSPAVFIPLAEETGLIAPLGHWVLESACKQLAIWKDQPDKAHLSISVNVSAVQLRQPDFVQDVLTVLQQTQINPERLKIEMTESLLLDNVEEVIAKMTALKAHGIGFALDDFGTGYSSLSYLKRLPLDQLKIDQSFVRDLLTDPNDATIARTIIALAESMGLSVIAEGVETQEQRDCLANEGCHAYQGYFFGKPLPLEAFEALLNPPT